MVTTEDVRKLALAFPEAVEQPHFEKTSFRVKKRIFATLDTNSKCIVVKLSEVDQSVFCEFNRGAIYPVNGAWGKQGWTTIEMSKVKKSIMKDALTTSYKNIYGKKLTRIKKK